MSTTSHADKGKPVSVVLWFNAALRVQGAPPDRAVTICATRQVVSWTEGRKTISVAIPDATISFKPWETEAWTWYGGGKWDTSVPASMSPSDAYMSGVVLPLPAGLSALASGMTWRAQFASDATGITLQWNWGVAPYLKFADDLNALRVVPVTGRNSDRAGTPGAFKQFAALPGGMDDRGIRFTGPRFSMARASAPKTFGCGGGY